MPIENLHLHFEVENATHPNTLVETPYSSPPICGEPQSLNQRLNKGVERGTSLSDYGV